MENLITSPEYFAGAIAIGALVADFMGVPFIYVRDEVTIDTDVKSIRRLL